MRLVIGQVYGTVNLRKFVSGIVQSSAQPQERACAVIQVRHDALFKQVALTAVAAVDGIQHMDDRIEVLGPVRNGA